ncbi:MAG: ABC transporter ATP-binding protein [Chloroflexota bacterium]|nr:MAG: ABC transporter ATP-binding protein [Chloroflexota bacterium]
MPSILETQDLVKTFGPSMTAVDGVSFSIEEGEIFSLLGPNGAGKTTTISMLSGLLKPTRGDAIIAGHSVTREPLEVKQTIGVVPQDIALYDTLSARENLMFWGRMYGMGGKELKRRVDEVLAQIGLSDRANARVETYSGGMKRRVNIGVGLLHRPKLIFMDEPTVGIDPQSRRNILDAVKALNQQGMTILYTTHNMDEAQELSHRVGIIDHGKLIALGTQKELTQLVGEHDLLRLHLGEEEDAATLAKALQAVPGVIQASADDHEVVVMVHEAEEALAPVITCTNDTGFRVRSVDIQEPNLEAVFLHLTGRALRD